MACPVLFTPNNAGFLIIFLGEKMKEKFLSFDEVMKFEREIKERNFLIKNEIKESVEENKIVKEVKEVKAKKIKW